jgi:hypothetical protein
MYLLKLIGEKECLCKFKIMSDSVQKFYLDQESFGEKEIKTEEKYSQDVINIRDLFRLLSLEDKVLVRRILSQENIF